MSEKSLPCDSGSRGPRPTGDADSRARGTGTGTRQKWSVYASGDHAGLRCVARACFCRVSCTLYSPAPTGFYDYAYSMWHVHVYV